MKRENQQNDMQRVAKSKSVCPKSVDLRTTFNLVTYTRRENEKIIECTVCLIYNTIHTAGFHAESTPAPVTRDSIIKDSSSCSTDI